MSVGSTCSLAHFVTYHGAPSIQLDRIYRIQYARRLSVTVTRNLRAVLFNVPPGLRSTESERELAKLSSSISVIMKARNKIVLLVCVCV